ncbi:MAG: hypothetical protein MUP39_02265, partial [Wolbachia endosymbiont of Homalodisca vitripennis]|nr:hypothetical protein [Wolbachia endosymbiont of Homalodisca vitripennis]
KLKEEISAIQTCEIYPSIRKELLAPALFVELVSLESGKDPGTEELALKARFEARIVIDSTIENAPIIVRSLASEVAKVVNKNTWNVENVSPGEFISAEIDGFRPELDAYSVWLIEWIHLLHIGRSIWKDSDIRQHKIVIGENVRE